MQYTAYQLCFHLSQSVVLKPKLLFQTNKHADIPIVKDMLSVYNLLWHDVLFMVAEVYPFMRYHISLEVSCAGLAWPR